MIAVLKQHIISCLFSRANTVSPPTPPPKKSTVNCSRRERVPPYFLCGSPPGLFYLVCMRKINCFYKLKKFLLAPNEPVHISRVLLVWFTRTILSFIRGFEVCSSRVTCPHGIIRRGIHYMGEWLRFWFASTILSCLWCAGACAKFNLNVSIQTLHE